VKYKIPKGLSGIVCRDKPILKAVSLLLYLKSKYTSGHIPFSAKQYNAWAKENKVSSRTIYTRLNELKKRGLVYFKGCHLYLCSYEKLNWTFKNQNSNYLYVKINNPAEYYMRAICLMENIQSQEYKLRQKYKDIDSRGLSFEKWIAAIERQKLYEFVNFRTSRENFLEQEINVPEFTLSQAGISKTLGHSFSSSGTYWNQKLAAMGLLQAERREVIQSKASNMYSCMGSVVRNRKGQTFLVRPNLISFSLFEKI
jgi:hypothetical protein